MSHPYPLTEAQIDFYRQNGFVRLEDVLTPGEVDELRRAVDEVLQMRFGEKVDFSSRDPAYEKIFVQKVNLWRVHDTIYMPHGTTYNGKPHVVTDGLDLSAGGPLAGELFPVLSAREANLLGEG